jgi:hypothetical protein
VVGTLVVARDGKDLVIVTEAVRGGKSLEDLVAGGRPLPPRIAAAIARSVIDGIATAHAAGITPRRDPPAQRRGRRRRRPCASPTSRSATRR